MANAKPNWNYTGKFLATVGARKRQCSGGNGRLCFCESVLDTLRPNARAPRNLIMEEKCECHCNCPPTAPDRRGFFKKFSTGLLGVLAMLGPIGASLAVLLDPVRRKSAGSGTFVQVTTLTSLPDDGVPRKFPIVASRVDAWNRSAAAPVGAIYLRRQKGKPIQALNVVCPHAGCFVDYVGNRNSFLCPCHNSTFALDGAINDPKSPSPRGLDELPVEVRNDDQVWVKFQNFRAGVTEKIPA